MVLISINYDVSLKYKNMMGRYEVVIDIVFEYAIVSKVKNDNGPKGQTIKEFQHQTDPK